MPVFLCALFGLALALAGLMRRPTSTGRALCWIGLVLGGLTLAEAASRRDPLSGSAEDGALAVLMLLGIMTAAILFATRNVPLE